MRHLLVDRSFTPGRSRYTLFHEPLPFAPMKHAYLFLLSLLPMTASVAQPTSSLLDAAYREQSTPKLEQYLQA